MHIFVKKNNHRQIFLTKFIEVIIFRTGKFCDERCEEKRGDVPCTDLARNNVSFSIIYISIKKQT